MGHEAINQTRYRTLVVAALLAFGLSLAAALLAWRLPGVHWSAWAVFLLSAALNLAMIPAAVVARRRGDKRALERIGVFLLAVAAVAMLQRVVWNAFGVWADHPEANPFRPVFNFVPFFFVAAIAMLRARRALALCWAFWGIVVAVALAGLWRAGVTLDQDGTITLLVWLVVANPLFILLLHALPQYEDALEASEAEVQRMREHAQLMDRLSESEQRFNLVVQALQVGVWDRWVGPPERRWWSPRFYELIGYTPEELAPTEENLRALLHPEDREEVWREGSEQMRRGDYLDVDFRLRTKHRGYRWFNSHAKASRDAAGRIVRLAGAIADIHEQRMAESALRDAQTELTELAYRDTLTRLHNRRAFDAHFERSWDQARRAHQPLSLLLIDLDYFKFFNDCYGHIAGDQCLQRVAEALQNTLRRPADFAARLGGEEFAVLLPDTPAAYALEIAGALAQALQALAIRHDTSPLGRVSASIGVATAQPAAGGEAATLFDQADKAMYEVKRRGRNGVLHAREVPAAASATGT